MIRGNKPAEFYPEKILITSLFTYWSKYVKESVEFYKKLYPNAKINVGGIYATLMPEHCKEYTDCDEIFIGLHKEAEKCQPAYDLVDVDYQIIHGMRGCIRRCAFCGTWKIEPELTHKKSIKDEICSNKLVFYDNNFLANPFVRELLDEIADLKHKGKPVRCESQSGFDGRLLTPELAKLLKKARFENPRIAWDHGINQQKSIKKQVDILCKVGYNRRDIYVFMIYNWIYDFKEMEKKRKKCKQWGVQIADCRYRPLDQTFDNYNPRKEQTKEDYFIHPKWTDSQVKLFRKNVRRQNIEIRYCNGKEYSCALERWGSIKRLYKLCGKTGVPKLKDIQSGNKRVLNEIEGLRDSLREKGIEIDV